jgi:predicted ATPase with chaperone activity
MLDLRYNATANFYQAPLHIKANGGVFLIDDFGRQIVDPRELLNRWILPLEDRIDFLSLATGRKVAVPFEQVTVFSTNLDPDSLMDEAFLRRLRHKIHLGPPSRGMLDEIFELACVQQGVTCDLDAVDYLFRHYYSPLRPPRSSDPRDLVEIAVAICRFRGESPRLDQEVLSEAARRFFCPLQGNVSG